MAPNASPFFNFNMDNHAIHIQKNVCHNFNYNNKTSTISLFRSRLKSIREQFVAVNSHYLRENVIESVSHYSPSTFVRKEKTENTWLNDMRSVSCMRLDFMRKMIIQQTMREKMEVWQQKKDEMARNRKFDISLKSEFQRDEIMVKKENYKMIFDQIKERAHMANKQAINIDHQQRGREICFKAVLTKAVLIGNILNSYFNDQQLVLKVGKQIEDYRSMESRLDVLKNIKVVEEAPLIAAQSLLKDLTLYKNNVVMPIQAEIETLKVQMDKKKNLLHIFCANKPVENIVKNVRRQYVALVKNNKLLINNLTNVRELPFVNDPTTKIFRQNVIKVINTLVNTISTTNVTHLTDKYNKLNALLSGKLVCVANTQVMIGENKEALAFCMQTLATKIVNYAEEVICVKTQAAYEIATIITKLWNAHQQFGKILFAEMKQKCPLLVPFYYPIAKHLNCEQIDHESFGYKFDSLGNVESDAKYLQRMTGIIRLYASLIVTSSKCDQPVIGLSQAWIFVAGTLNQNPVADITATILVEFLKIVGFAMHQRYGNQFIKLLKYINTHFLKKIILVTPEGNGGPITRLNSFLSRSLCTGSIEEPKGILFDF
ncbi:mRNA export factor Gle1-like [Metopolophium dirhodum]|uniref:mRNA export factor Gle1-like n=1 Tax=Metopolophium dirhodum TaxID=44670 RepID=UPI00298FB80B|nr:mRNA export factor Gle1-like [Metopolophium dirhodum]